MTAAGLFTSIKALDYNSWVILRMNDRPLSNGRLGSLLTLENIIVLTTCLMGIAVSYGALSSDVAKLQDERTNNSHKISQIQEDVSKVRTDVEVIKTEIKGNNERYKEQLERIEQDRRRQERMLGEILNEVRSQ